jgi:hypothetical protein
MPDSASSGFLLPGSRGMLPYTGTLYNIGRRNKSRIFLNYFCEGETFAGSFRLCASKVYSARLRR